MCSAQDTDISFDPSIIRNLADGDTAFLIEIVTLFIREAPEQLLRIQHAIDSGDSAGLQLAAHSLKGASASLGALGLANCARQLEALARQGDISQAGELNTTLKRQFELLQPKLQQLLADSAG